MRRMSKPTDSQPGASRLGLGNGRERTGVVLGQAFWFGDCAQRAYSPDHAESGGQGLVPHRHVDRFPSTCARNRSLGRTHESTSGPVAASVGNHRCELSGQRSQSGSRRFAACRFGLFGCRECTLAPGGSWLKPRLETSKGPAKTKIKQEYQTRKETRQ